MKNLEVSKSSELKAVDSLLIEDVSVLETGQLKIKAGDSLKINGVFKISKGAVFSYQPEIVSATDELDAPLIIGPEITSELFPEFKIVKYSKKSSIFRYSWNGGEWKALFTESDTVDVQSLAEMHIGDHILRAQELLENGDWSLVRTHPFEILGEPGLLQVLSTGQAYYSPEQNSVKLQLSEEIISEGMLVQVSINGSEFEVVDGVGQVEINLEGSYDSGVVSVEWQVLNNESVIVEALVTNVNWVEQEVLNADLNENIQFYSQSQQNTVRPIWKWSFSLPYKTIYRWSWSDSNMDENSHYVSESFAVSNRDLAEGVHQIYVQAKNLSGQWSVPKEGRIIVDLTSPIACQVLNSSNVFSNSKPSIRFNSNEADFAGHFVELFDKKGLLIERITTMTHSWSPSKDLLDGEYALVVRELDLAGNKSPAVKFDFFVDDTPPKAPGLFVKLDDPLRPIWSWKLPVDGVGYSAKLNDFPISEDIERSANGLFEFTPELDLEEGKYVFVVITQDKAGNISEEAISIVDTIVPTGPKIEGLKVAVDKFFVAIESPRAGDRSYRYKFDDLEAGSWVTKPGAASALFQISINQLDEGEHKFYLQELVELEGEFIWVDASNVSFTKISAEKNLVLINEWPLDQLEEDDDLFLKSLRPSFSWSYFISPAYFNLSINKIESNTATTFLSVVTLKENSYQTLKDMPEGNYKLKIDVKATLLKREVHLASLVKDFTVDRVPPLAPKFLNTHLTMFKGPDARFQWASRINEVLEENMSPSIEEFRYSIDRNCDKNSKQVTGLSVFLSENIGEGEHIIQLQERDESYNWSESASFKFYLDQSAPVISPGSELLKTLYSVNEALVFSAEITDLGVGVMDSSISVFIGGKRYAHTKTNNKIEFQINESLSEGSYEVKILAQDLYGFSSEYKTTITISSQNYSSILYVDSEHGLDENKGLSLNPETSNGPLQKIQAAIDASNEGGLVLIQDGIYLGPGNVDLNFNGKNLTIKAINNGSVTIDLATTPNQHAFKFVNGEDHSSVVTGINMIHGSNSYGGAVYVRDSSPKFENCSFVENKSSYGGAVCILGAESNPVYTKCSMIGNSAELAGGMGLVESSSSPVFRQCIIKKNKSLNTSQVLFIKQKVNEN